MKVTDCFWELDNIGKKTVEVRVESSDCFDASAVSAAVSGYEYMVVKVPVNKLEFNLGLQDLGFTFVETQFHISKTYKSFDFEDRLVKIVTQGLEFHDITTPQELEQVAQRITPDMFTTDRVCLDPVFGPETGRRRYVNWMKSAWSRGDKVFEYSKDGRRIGFALLKYSEDGSIVDGLLGGIYSEYQDEGLGLLTPAVPFLYAKDRNQPFKKMITSISSNNKGVVLVYNLLGFSVNSMEYIFIKHKQSTEQI